MPLRSDVYHFLAEALSEPPDWLALPGSDWPLTRAAASFTDQYPAARERLAPALEALEAVPPGRLEERQKVFKSLLSSPGLWLNEAGALSGRLLNDATWEIERRYNDAGLEIPGAELPDHASLELEFLSFLSAAEHADWHLAEAPFLKQHAGRWLPELGRQLSASRDAVYSPIGKLLTAWLALVLSDEKRTPFRDTVLQPQVSAACILCMVCLSACPVEAIRVQESPQVTRLVLLSEDCHGCGECAQSCDHGAITMAAAEEYVGGSWQVLFASPRGVCLQCGAPLVSEAELSYVSSILGHRSWINSCPDCR